MIQPEPLIYVAIEEVVLILEMEIKAVLAILHISTASIIVIIEKSRVVYACTQQPYGKHTGSITFHVMGFFFELVKVPL